MVGSFDQRVDQFDDDNEGNSAGLSPLDVTDLPDDQRQIMLTFFRDAKESAGILTLESLQTCHDTIDHIDQILGELTRDKWLIRLGEPPNERYKVNFRRRRASRLDSDLWSSITDRLVDDSDSDSNSNTTLPSLSDW